MKIPENVLRSAGNTHTDYTLQDFDSIRRSNFKSEGPGEKKRGERSQVEGQNKREKINGGEEGIGDVMGTKFKAKDSKEEKRSNKMCKGWNKPTHIGIYLELRFNRNL